MSQTKPSSLSNPPEGFLCIGAIVQPHGIRGEVRAHIFNPDSDSLFQIERIWLRQPGIRKLQPFRLIDARDHTKGVLISIEGCTTRNQAETYRRSEIFIRKNALPELEEDEFYFYQLEGLPVFSTEGEELGTVLRVMSGAAQDLLVLNYQKREVLIPIIDAIVPTIDVPNRRIEIHVLPGLLD